MKKQPTTRNQKSPVRQVSNASTSLKAKVSTKKTVIQSVPSKPVKNAILIDLSSLEDSPSKVSGDEEQYLKENYEHHYSDHGENNANKDIDNNCEDLNDLKVVSSH